MTETFGQKLNSSGPDLAVVLHSYGLESGGEKGA